MTSTPTTIIGSLPHATPEEALSALAEFPLGIPAWPQLPKRSFLESMVGQFCEGFPGIAFDKQAQRIWLKRDSRLLDEMAVFYDAVVADNTDSFAISAEYAAGLHGFIDNCKRTGEKLAVTKGQITGPFTFGLSLTDDDCRSVWFDEQYRDIVLKGLTMKAVWQARQLKIFSEKVIITLDEPIFSALGTPAYLGIEDEDVTASINEIANQLHENGASVGVHCCGNMDWSLLTRTKVDILSFDACQYGEKVALYSREIQTFLERGGILAWGLVPTTPGDVSLNEGVHELKRKLSETEGYFTQKNVPLELLRTRRIFTPSCGMGNMTVPAARRALQLLGQLAEECTR